MSNSWLNLKKVKFLNLLKIKIFQKQTKLKQSETFVMNFWEIFAKTIKKKKNTHKKQLTEVVVVKSRIWKKNCMWFSLIKETLNWKKRFTLIYVISIHTLLLFIVDFFRFLYLKLFKNKCKKKNKTRKLCTFYLLLCILYFSFTQNSRVPIMMMMMLGTRRKNSHPKVSKRTYFWLNYCVNVFRFW